VLIDIKNEIRLLENSFSILLGYAPRKIDRTSMGNQGIDIPLDIGLPSQLLRNRPDVMAAEAHLMNAFELTNVARSSFYPSLRLSAADGFRSLDIAELFNANSLFSNLIASVAQPLINGRQIRTQYEVSQAQKEIALIDFERSLLIASREVSDAMYN
jgi:outer membrane protein TolC